MMNLSKQLPPEILREIFKWLHMSSLSSFESGPVDGGRIFELCWPVSSVCKYWREVALASPFLWTYLPRITLRDDRVDESSLSNDDPQPCLDTLKELISRAQNAALHPSFTCTATTVEGPRMSGVATHLITRCSQWRSVSISGIVDSIALFFRDVGGEIPCLETLRLEYYPRRTKKNWTTRMLLMFVESPMLKSVHISGSSDWKLELDTRSLVYLYDGVGGIIHNITTSHGYPKLTTLEIQDHGFFDFTDLEEDDFTLALPVLQILVYKCDDTTSVDEGFLLFPVTPSLEELSIAAPDGDVITHLVNMCNRSAGSLPLKSLRILENPMEECHDGDLAGLLQRLPNLEILETAFPSQADIYSLAIREGDEVLVPRLKKCSFEYRADNFDNLNGPLRKLVTARCEPSAKKQGSGGEGVATMELIINASIWRDHLGDGTNPGFGDGKYGYLGIQPTRIESWYGDRAVRPSAYTKAVDTIPHMLTHCCQTNVYEHILELIAQVEQEYRAEELGNFLVNEANTNICMISAAYAFKTQLSNDNQVKNPPYKRVVCLLQRVKGDLTRKLNSFHWIWETSLDKIWTRYIPNDHEVRSDPDKFANAILGISDDLWILEDLRTT